MLPTFTLFTVIDNDCTGKVVEEHARDAGSPAEQVRLRDQVEQARQQVHIDEVLELVVGDGFT